MESKVKMPSLRLDIRNMGGLFYLPFIMMMIAAAYVTIHYSGYSDNQNMLKYIRHDFGVLSIPLVIVWIIGLFQDFVETKGKEAILALPYSSTYSGIMRVLRMSLLYVVIFFILFVFLVIRLLPGHQLILLSDICLPILSVLYFAALSFLFMMIVKNSIVCYIIIGVYSIFLYMTRGAFTFGLYPFQWSFPQPNFDELRCTVILLIASVIGLYISQKIFQNKEFLLK